MSNSPFLSNCTTDTVRDAAAALKAGYLVAFPTETVYGLGADATNPIAVARIYEAKGRPSDHPLIVHIADLKYLDQWIADMPEYAIALARDYWPGPMTLILKRSELAKDFITGNQETVGVRVPNNSIALGLLEAFHKLGGSGIAAPSANRFGQVSPTTASAVIEELGDYLNEEDLVLDGGPSAVGLESTIIDCTGTSPRILRPGAITVAMIEKTTRLEISKVLDEETIGTNELHIRFSGSLENHYSPKAKVLLDQQPVTGSGYIALTEIPTPPGVIRLAAPKSVEEFAQVLYEALRSGDHQNLTAIYVSQPTGDGLAVAIRDRLLKASN
jgi:L-threonylcarbamoyladenylate synthase